MLNSAQFQRALAAWYETHGRHTLPWRNTRDPYAIWISEVMLQQTQVKTVLEKYYTPFLTQFPTVAALGNAAREDVLKAWAGLGYYRRAGFLHDAARACGSAMPKTLEALMALPGIGQNTAHAIASFAYGTPAPVMEANVKRVISRLFALTTPKEKQLWQLAYDLLPPQAGGCRGEWSPTHCANDFVRAKSKLRCPPPLAGEVKNIIFVHNQAMMDLGAMICTPKRPACERCPVNPWCKGKVAPELYPAKIKAKAVPVKQRNILIIEHEGLIYAEPREGNHLGGLYRFMETESDHITINDASFNLTTLPHRPITHHYSHYTLEAKVYRLQLPKLFKRHSNTWWSTKELAKLPMSNLEKKALTALAA